MLPNLLNTAVIVFGGWFVLRMRGEATAVIFGWTFMWVGNWPIKSREADKGPADSFDHCRTAWWRKFTFPRFKKDTWKMLSYLLSVSLFCPLYEKLTSPAHFTNVWCWWLTITLCVCVCVFVCVCVCVHIKRFNIQKFYIFPLQHVYFFFIDLRTANISLCIKADKIFRTIILCAGFMRAKLRLSHWGRKSAWNVARTSQSGGTYRVFFVGKP
jgi:hypothetical protein